MFVGVLKLLKLFASKMFCDERFRKFLIQVDWLWLRFLQSITIIMNCLPNEQDGKETVTEPFIQATWEIIKLVYRRLSVL